MYDFRISTADAGKVMRKLIQWERVMHLRNVNQDGGTDTK